MDTDKIRGWAHTHTDRAIYLDIKQRARHLRQNPTPAEATIWQRLRRRQVKEFSFRQQHPIGQFIVDFYCSAARLVIEIDGPIHDEPEQNEYDMARQAYLQEIGLRVLRFSNAEAIHQTDAVVETIAKYLSNTPD